MLFPHPTVGEGDMAAAEVTSLCPLQPCCCLAPMPYPSVGTFPDSPVLPCCGLQGMLLREHQAWLIRLDLKLSCLSSY